MERLTKYLLVVYSVLAVLCLILIALNIYSNVVENNLKSQLQYDEDGNRIGEMKLQENNLQPYQQFMLKFIIFVFPVLVVFMSGLYMFREKCSYSKSLIIPGSYVVVGIIASIFVSFSVSDGGMLVIFAILPQIVITFILSLIVNGIILYSVGKN